MARRTLYLVDAHAYLHRAYHALPPLTNSKGEPVGALLGFAKTLLAIVRRDKPDLLAVCFDTPGPTFRHKKFEAYKATRKPIDPALKVQLAGARELAAGMGLATVELAGYEADDLMATLARRGEAAGMDVVVVSGDKDALQLVGGRIRVLNEAKGVLYDAAKVEEKFKVAPGQLIDYLALTGDTVDNVKGVPGVGAVGAAKLLGRFKTVEALLKAAAKNDPEIPAKTAKALLDSRDSLKMGQELITLEGDAPIKLKPQDCRYELSASEALVGVFRRLEFNALLKELAPDAVPAAAAVRAPAREVCARALPIAELLKKAAKAPEISVAAAKPRQPDLLQAGEWTLSLGLPSGEAAAFDEAARREHRLELKALLLSEKMTKVGHDLKLVRGLLIEAGLELRGPKFDTFLAAYCLNPGRGRYPLETLLEETGGSLPEGPQAAALAEAAAVWGLRAKQEKELPEKSLERLYWELEMPLLDVLGDMEREGFALDCDYLKSLRGEFAARIAELKAEMDALAGTEINLNSPKQIGKLLFEDLKLPVVHKTRKGAVSTDEETLSALAPLHPLPAKLIDYRELSKLQSTYIEALL